MTDIRLFIPENLDEAVGTIFEDGKVIANIYTHSIFNYGNYMTSFTDSQRILSHQLKTQKLSKL